MKRTQREWVLALLKSGKTISSMEAFEARKITRLAAIIFDLRAEGHDIESIRKERLSPDGKVESWWVEYKLAA